MGVPLPPAPACPWMGCELGGKGRPPRKGGRAGAPMGQGRAADSRAAGSKAPGAQMAPLSLPSPWEWGSSAHRRGRMLTGDPSVP